MPSTFSLAPIPIWIILEPNGQPASGVIMYPRSTLNHDVVKNVYQDSGGLIPWPLNADGGIVFQGNGTQGPFYWENTGIANDLYFLTFYDEAGQLIYTVDKYPQTGGGGSGPVTNLININNFIIDGQFSYNDLGSSTIAPVPLGDTVIQKIAFPKSPQNSSGGWFFIKDVAGNTDSISIPQTSLSDVTPSNPRNRFVYSCTVAGTVGNVLDLTFQIPDVKTFSNQELRFQFQASATGSASPGVMSEVVVTQNFGTGGSPSATIETPFAFTWPAVESLVPVSITVPTVAGKSRGTNNDDFIYISIRFPIGVTGVYSVTNVMGVQGTTQPSSYIYDTQNEVFYKILASMVQDSFFQTGDIVMNWNGIVGTRPGWLAFGDGTSLGKTGSLATTTGQIYFNLYSFLWNHVLDAQAPVTPGGRGVSALVDWNALKKIQIPFTSQRALINFFNGGYQQGQAVGASSVSLSIANLPAHSHTLAFQLLKDGASLFLSAGSSAPGFVHSGITTTNSTGSGTAFNIIPPETVASFWIKL